MPKANTTSRLQRSATDTHFLQLYLGLTPNFAQAFFNGDPGLKFIFFAPRARTVIWSLVEARTEFELETVKALAVAKATTKRHKIVNILDMLS